MATDFRTRTASRWDSANSNLDAAEAAATALADHPHGKVREKILALLQDSAAELFSIAPPALGGIARKLEVYWGDSLWEGGPASDWRKIVVGDIRRLERIAAGISEPEASGGMDRNKIADDWNQAVRQYDELAQTGPDGRIDLRDGAQAELLSKSAPTLAAVIRKLEIFWEDNRHDPILESSDHLLIMRDVRRFATRQNP